MKFSKAILWIVRIIVAVILIQTLYFKFTAHPDSVYIFEQTGLGSIGRIGSGIAELVIALLIIIPRASWLGAIGGICLMAGAIFFHFTTLGIEVNGDGGTLFILANVVFIGSLYILWRSRKDIPFLNFN